MKHSIYLLAMTGVSLPAVAATPAFEKTWEACRNEAGKLPLLPDELEGCEAVIASPEAPAENRAIAHTNRGMIMAKANFLVTAKDEYDRAIALDPRLAAAYYNRAVLHTDLEEFASAKADLDKAIELNPKMEVAFLQRGVVYAQTKNFLAAIADFDKVIQLESDAADAYLMRGYAKLELGQKAEGEADVAKAKSINPTVDQ
jgi:lipoprotein NlpI